MNSNNFNIGEIVVRINSEHMGMHQGNMGIIKCIRYDLLIELEEYRGTHCEKNMRKAAEREIAAYKKGIKNIKEIPENFQTNYIPLIWN